MTNPDELNQEIQQAMQQIDAAGRQASNAPEHSGSPAHVRQDEIRKRLIQDLDGENGLEIPQADMPNTGGLPTTAAWIELQRNQPFVPLHQLRDPLQAMGVAMCHISSATLQYGLIQGIQELHGLQDLHGPCSGGCENPERYLQAENDARIAHAVLHRTYTSLATGHPRGPEIRRHCREANLWLTWERSRAARALGIDPPPEISGDLQHGELDWDHWDAAP